MEPGPLLLLVENAQERRNCSTVFLRATVRSGRVGSDPTTSPGKRATIATFAGRGERDARRWERSQELTIEDGPARKGLIESRFQADGVANAGPTSRAQSRRAFTTKTGDREGAPSDAAVIRCDAGAG